MELLLAKLSPRASLDGTRSCVDQDILTKLSDQHRGPEEQKRPLVRNNASPNANTEVTETSGPGPGVNDAEARYDSDTVDTSELLRLKQELHVANSKIALQEQELAQTRVIKHTLDQALGPPSDTDLGSGEVTEQTICNLQDALNTSSYTMNQYRDSWNEQEDEQSDASDSFSGAAYNIARGFWAAPSHSSSISASTAEKGFCEPFPFTGSSVSREQSPWVRSAQNSGFSGPFQSHQALSSPPPSSCNIEPTRFSAGQGQFLRGPGSGVRRQAVQANHAGSCFPFQNSLWEGLAPGPLNIALPRAPGHKQYGSPQHFGMYPVPPTASEFSLTGSNVTSWGAPPVSYPVEIV